MKSLLRSLFGCRHRVISRVFWHRELGCNYVVCMGCCQRFAYDWQTMTMGERLDPPPQQEAA